MNEFEDDRDRRADDRPPADPRYARARTAAPGMILIILGIFGVLVGVAAVVFVHNLSGIAAWMKSVEEKQPPGPDKDKLKQQIEQIENVDTPEARTFNTFLYGGAVVASLLIILGGVKMRSLSGYPLAMLGAVLATIPYNGCCVIATPFGIWAVVTLLNADVRAGFAARRAVPEGY